MQTPQNSLRRLIGAPALLPVAMMAALATSASSAREPLTIRAAIETTRPMTDRNGNAVFTSPDGLRYAILLITGDVERDGVWAELRVGGLESLATVTPQVVTRLFTRARGAGYQRHGGSEVLVHPQRNVPRWVDNDHIALLWEDEHMLRQAVSVNVNSGELRYLTHHSTDVVHFSALPDGTLLYGAQVPCTLRPTSQEQARGYIVDFEDASSLLYGCGAWTRDEQALFVKSPGQEVTRQIEMQGGDTVNRSQPWFPSALLSPSGDRAIFPNTVSEIPSDWHAYTTEHFRAMWKSREGGSKDPYASQFQQLFVIDVAKALAKVLWRVPHQSHSRIAWSPDARTVLVGPTFLPVAAADAAGLAAGAVAAVDVRSGRFQQLPVLPETARRIRELRWISAREVEIGLDGGCLRYRKTGSQWMPAPGEPGCLQVRGRAAVRIDLEQGLNLPPRFVAVDRASAQRRVVLDPNEGLSARFSLGDVQWLDVRAGGHHWEGRLYYPAEYEAGKRYPLVIQTHWSAGRDEFSLYSRPARSAAIGPGMSAYIAQPLASRGFFVVHGRATDVGTDINLLEQTKAQMAATEAVTDELVRQGLVDRSRVGLMGYSASGWDVSYAISHSTFPYAASLTDDNKDGGYMQVALSGWLYGAGEEMIGAPAFGAGLQTWLAESPAFNVERVSTPLLTTVTTPGMELFKWELFSRLRKRAKPVELYVVPDLAHGSHGLQNPTQLLALQGRALDWWCFWLKDEEDADPAKAAQYAHWHVLREQQRNASARTSE